MAAFEMWEHKGLKKDYKDILTVYNNNLEGFENLNDDELLMIKTLKKENIEIDETNLLILDVLKNYSYKTFSDTDNYWSTSTGKYSIGATKKNIEMIRNYIDKDKRIDFIGNPYYIYILETAIFSGKFKDDNFLLSDFAIKFFNYTQQNGVSISNAKIHLMMDTIEKVFENLNIKTDKGLENKDFKKIQENIDYQALLEWNRNNPDNKFYNHHLKTIYYVFGKEEKEKILNMLNTHHIVETFMYAPQYIYGEYPKSEEIEEKPIEDVMKHINFLLAFDLDKNYENYQIIYPVIKRALKNNNIKIKDLTDEELKSIHLKFQTSDFGRDYHKSYKPNIEKFFNKEFSKNPVGQETQTNLNENPSKNKPGFFKGIINNIFELN